MTRSHCTSCGLIHEPGQCHQQILATPAYVPVDVTPLCCCTCYFSIIASFVVFCLIFFGRPDGRNRCYVELFANSVSVSSANVNANVSAADWRIGFVAKSPVTGCKVSIHTLNSRLLRHGQIISKSASPLSGYFYTGDKTEVVFEKVVMPGAIGDVIWDSQVEIVFAMNTDVEYLHGFLFAYCPTIPVKITTDREGYVMGSLLGNKRRCDYTYQKRLD